MSNNNCIYCNKHYSFLNNKYRHQAICPENINKMSSKKQKLEAIEIDVVKQPPTEEEIFINHVKTELINKVSLDENIKEEYDLAMQYLKENKSFISNSNRINYRGIVNEQLLLINENNKKKFNDFEKYVEYDPIGYKRKLGEIIPYKEPVTSFFTSSPEERACFAVSDGELENKRLQMFVRLQVIEYEQMRRKSLLEEIALKKILKLIAKYDDNKLCRTQSY